MLKKTLKKKVRDWCEKNYHRKIDMFHDKRFQPLVNNRCQMNAAALVASGKSVAVVECVMIHADDARCTT